MASVKKHPTDAVDETPKTFTGRTQWDALVDVLRLLGNAGPYLMIVGLVLFGFYKFQELSQQRDVDLQKVRETATESYRQQLSAANKALVDTYQAMGSISGTQIKNLSEMLELHAKATTRTQELQQAQEQQRLKLDQALRDVETAGTQKKQVEGDLKNIQDNVARDKTELERLETALKEGRRNLSDSAVQVSAVRDKMIQLARAVRNNEASSATRLATDILKENSDPVDIKPGESDANALKALIGRSEADTVADLVKSAAFVIRNNIRRDDKSNGSRLYAGEAASGGLFRNVTQLESDGSRIVSTDVASLFGTVTPDEDDWYSLRKYVVIHSEYSSTGRGLSKDKEMWGLEDIAGKNEVLKDYPDKLPFLTLDQLGKEAPDVFAWFKNSAFGELQSGMSERAKVFEADSLLPVSNAGELSGIPRDLRDVAARLFSAAVKRRVDEAESLIANSSSPPLPGQVAAIVLHPDFEFTKYMPSADGDPSKSTNSAILIGHYDYRLHGFRKFGMAREQLATFVFSRRGNAGWQLEQLTLAPKDPLSALR